MFPTSVLHLELKRTNISLSPNSSLGEGKFINSGDGDRLICLVDAVVPADLLSRECAGTLLPVRLFGTVLPLFNETLPKETVTVSSQETMRIFPPKI